MPRAEPSKEDAPALATALRSRAPTVKQCEDAAAQIEAAGRQKGADRTALCYLMHALRSGKANAAQLDDAAAVLDSRARER